MNESGDGRSLAKRMMEDEARRLAERRRARLGCVAVFVAFIALIIGGRVAYKWAKVARAEQFAKQGDELTAAGKHVEAAGRYRAALQLAPMNYHALRSGALLGMKISPPQAVDLWTQVLRLPQATDSDRQNYVRSLFMVGQVTAAGPTLMQLVQKDPDMTTLLLAAEYARTTGDLAKATDFARLAVEKAPEDVGAKFMLTELLAASASEAQHTEARKILWEIAEKPGPFQGKAIQGLAKARELTTKERERLLEKLGTRAENSLHEALLAADLRIKLHPEDASKIYDEVVARWGKSDGSDLNELVRWFNLHSQPERALALLPMDRAAGDNELVLSRLDALAALQRWDEIENFLLQPRLDLHASILEAFRARTAQEKGKTMDAEVHWNHAISLAANDPKKLRFVASFASQNKAPEIALKAYEQLAKIPEHAVDAYLATERMSMMNANTKVARDAAEKVAHLSPNDVNAADQLDYLNLLLGQDVDASLARAKERVQKYPTRVAFRVTAALGYLRTNDPGRALAAFQPPPGAPPIEWDKAPPAWRVVYAATLQANEKTEEAAEVLKAISLDQLSPEERGLVEGAKATRPES